jgi:hypothetical protein
MRQFIVIVVTLIMFFAAGIQLDFGEDVELPEWVEEIVSEDKGSMVDMTHSPIFKIAKTRMGPIDEELALPSAR